METLRRMYGMAEPIRRGMELKIVRGGNFRPQVLGGPVGGNIHEDILALGGRDCEVSWEDVFKGMDIWSISNYASLYLEYAKGMHIIRKLEY
jgi:proteasome maturation protein